MSMQIVRTRSKWLLLLAAWVLWFAFAGSADATHDCLYDPSTGVAYSCSPHDTTSGSSAGGATDQTQTTQDQNFLDANNPVGNSCPGCEVDTALGGTGAGVVQYGPEYSGGSSGSGGTVSGGGATGADGGGVVTNSGSAGVVGGNSGSAGVVGGNSGSAGIVGGNSAYQGQPVVIRSPLKEAINTIPKLIQTLLQVFVVLAVPVIVFFIILAGFKYVTAKGDANQVKDATKALTYAVIGGLLVIGAASIAAILGNMVNSIMR